MTMVHHIPHNNPVFCDSEIPRNSEVEQFIQILDEEYGKLIDTDDPEFLLAEGCFEPHLKILKPIPVIVSPKKPTREYTMTDRELAEQIIEDLNRSGGENHVDVVEKRLKNRKREEPVSGTYHHEECPEIITVESETACEAKGGPYIMIYYYHFPQELQEDKAELRVALSNCLAHEYFHYYHDRFAADEFNKSGKGKQSRERVKEALADYFSVAYTLLLAKKIQNQSGNKEYEKYFDYADKRAAQWEQRFGSDWPYAYALYFCTVNCKQKKWGCGRSPYDRYTGCRLKFYEVLVLSKENMVKAYYESLMKKKITNMCDFS